VTQRTRSPSNSVRLISGIMGGVAQAGGGDGGDKVVAPGSPSSRSSFQGVGAGEKAVAIDPSGGQFVTVGRSDPNARVADDFFGCENDTWPPSFVYQGVIQGPSDFLGCVNLSHSDWTVCLDYGGPLQACNSGTHWYGEVAGQPGAPRTAVRPTGQREVGGRCSRLCTGLSKATRVIGPTRAAMQP
jgi:hypothetical protein